MLIQVYSPANYNIRSLRLQVNSLFGKAQMEHNYFPGDEVMRSQQLLRSIQMA